MMHFHNWELQPFLGVKIKYSNFHLIEPIQNAVAVFAVICSFYALKLAFNLHPYFIRPGR